MGILNETPCKGSQLSQGNLFEWAKTYLTQKLSSITFPKHIFLESVVEALQWK